MSYRVMLTSHFGLTHTLKLVSRGHRLLRRVRGDRRVESERVFYEMYNLNSSDKSPYLLVVYAQID